MTDFNQARLNMIDGQVHPAGVVDTSILQSFGIIPREMFVPEKLQHVAYTDECVDIGQKRFLMEPIVHAKLLQAVHPRKEDVVLDIGIGSGYSSAVLSSIVTTIIALEKNKRQMDKATRLWESFDMCNIALIQGKLNEGAPDHAPYSLILINGAVERVPEMLLDQMDIGGRLATVVKEKDNLVGQATLFLKNADSSVSSKPLFDAGVPYLEGFEPQPEFQF